MMEAVAVRARMRKGGARERCGAVVKIYSWGHSDGELRRRSVQEKGLAAGEKVSRDETRGDLGGVGGRTGGMGG